MKKIVLASLMLSMLTGCSYINKWCGLKDDNIIEEGVEAAIKVETGLDVDLTPGTPEK